MSKLTVSSPHTSILVLEAYAKLLSFDFHLALGNFSALHKKVRSCHSDKAAAFPNATERICAAVDLACVWYWKEVRCLQRSAVATCLLKRHGVPAQMVIGAQQIPFRAHAWVEVDGRVVNDKPYMRQMYAVLDHC